MSTGRPAVIDEGGLDDIAVGQRHIVVIFGPQGHVAQADIGHDPLFIHDRNPVPDPHHLAEGDTGKKPDEGVAEGDAYHGSRHRGERDQRNHVDVHDKPQDDQASDGHADEQNECPQHVGNVRTLLVDQMILDDQKVHELEQDERDAEVGREIQPGSGS